MCQNEVRVTEEGGFEISKRCKQSHACDNNVGQVSYVGSVLLSPFGDRILTPLILHSYKAIYAYLSAVLACVSVQYEERPH